MFILHTFEQAKFSKEKKKIRQPSKPTASVIDHLFDAPYSYYRNKKSTSFSDDSTKTLVLLSLGFLCDILNCISL